MAIPPRLPTVAQVLELAKSFDMTLTEEDAASFRGLMAGSIASYARLDELVEPKLPVKYPRDPGYRPSAEENPFNAWYWKSHIAGAGRGILAGERVAVKDNICVAGVPMMNGSRVLEGYVPELVLLLGEYMHRHYHNRYHAKAQNLRVLLRAAYDAVLADYDLLAMPTIPFPATEIPPADAPREVYVDAALNMQQNTCPFDVSGHPALTVPCGKVRGLPVGAMLVGRHFEETTVIKAAQAIEKAGDWRTR